MYTKDQQPLELTSNFQAKLSWLVGNLYSRVETEDFVPGCYEDPKEFVQYVSGILAQNVAWVPTEIFPMFKEIYNKNNSMTENELLESAEKKIEEEKNRKLENLTNLISKNLSINNDQKQKLKNFLNSNQIKKNYLNF